MSDNTLLQPETLLQTPPNSFTPESVRTQNGQVFIKSPTDPAEWMYVELQGELQSTSKGVVVQKGSLSGSTGSHLFSLPLGTMTVDGSVRNH